MASRRKDLLEILGDKVLVGDECWEWTGARYLTGYGCVYTPGRRQSLAHRVFYELLVGPLPRGIELHHSCGVKHCVRPAHLEPLSHREHGLVTLAETPLASTCKNGHSYSDENTYVNKRGRVCRRCRASRWRRYMGSA